MKDMFLIEMVEQQAFVEDLEIFDQELGVVDIVEHPFNNSETARLVDAFDSEYAIANELTLEFLQTIVSGMSPDLNSRLTQLVQ